MDLIFICKVYFKKCIFDAPVFIFHKMKVLAGTCTTPYHRGYALALTEIEIFQTDNLKDGAISMQKTSFCACMCEELIF